MGSLCLTYRQYGVFSAAAASKAPLCRVLRVGNRLDLRKTTTHLNVRVVPRVVDHNEQDLARVFFQHLVVGLRHGQAIDPNTGGWGFEGFKGGDRAQRVVQDGAKCFACHAPLVNDRFVFSKLRG